MAQAGAGGANDYSKSAAKEGGSSLIPRQHEFYVEDMRDYDDDFEQTLLREIQLLPFADKELAVVQQDTNPAPIPFEADWILGDRLGAGAFGVVFRATLRNAAAAAAAAANGTAYAVKLFKKTAGQVPVGEIDIDDEKERGAFKNIVDTIHFLGGDMRAFDMRQGARRLSGLVREAQVMKYLNDSKKDPDGREFLLVDDVRFYESRVLFAIVMPRQWQSLKDVFNSMYVQPLQNLMVLGQQQQQQPRRQQQPQIELTLRDVAQLWEQVLKGARFMHRNGILHLDLKLDNVMVSNDTPRQAKIIDFGMCRKTRDKANDLLCRFVNEITEQFKGGTSTYMAPEVAYMENEVPDGRADVWSIGVIFYFLLRCKFPFPGEIRANSELPETLKPNIKRTTFLDKIKKDALQEWALHDQLRHSLIIDPKNRDTVDKALARGFLHDTLAPASQHQLGAFMQNAVSGNFNAAYDVHVGHVGGSDSEHEFATEPDSDGEYIIRRYAGMHGQSRDEVPRHNPAHQPRVAPDHPVAIKHRQLKREQRALLRKLAEVGRLVGRAHAVVHG